MSAARFLLGWLCVVCAAGLSAEDIAVSQCRPLSKLALELQARFGYPVTYEEAPYDSGALRTEVRSGGSRYSSPGWVPIVFHVPDVASLTAEAASSGRVPPGLSDVVLPLIAEYNKSGNPGKFQVYFEDGYAHIVPAARIVEGKAIAFEPILDTQVSFSANDSSCEEALDALLEEIGRARGVSVVKGAVPIGALLSHRCSVVANQLPARTVLASILEQLGMSSAHAGLRSRFSWALLYDSNTDKYFLSTTLLPDLVPHPSGGSTQPVQGVPAASVPTSGTSRTSVPGPGRKK